MIKDGLALVTGATSGIGQALCIFLAQKGIRLLITGRNKEKLKQLEDQLSSHTVLEVIAADLADVEERKRVIKAIHTHAPNLIINNAGFGLYGESLTYSTDNQKEILEVNGTAILEISLEAARTLISKKQKGVILNVSSAAAFQIFPFAAVYAASKAFVNQFSQSFDEEVKSYGIRVLAICPGMVETSFSTRAGGCKQTKQKEVMTAEFVAEQIWEQIHSLKPLRIIDWKYRLLTILSYFVPKQWVATIIKKNIAERIAPRNIIEIEQ